jgi:hypothetical protein
MTTRIKIPAMILALCCGWMSSAFAQQEAPKEAPEAPKEVTCFESRKGASEVVQRDLKPGQPNVKCSPKTGAVLWWSDALDGTVPMGDMPEVAKAHSDKAFVKPRSEKLALMPLCGTACHNGVGPKANPPKLPTSKKPTPCRPWPPWCLTCKTCSTAAPHLVPGLPPHHPAQQAGGQLWRPGQL